MVASLLDIHRRQQEDIVGDNEETKREREEQQKSYERKYRAALLEQPVEQLRLALKVQQETPDTRGRLHNERSGEKLRKLAGISELEIIDAARQHDLSLSGIQEQDPLLAHGFRVRPEGHGPDSDEAPDESGDPGRPAKRPTYLPTAAERWRDAAIKTIVQDIAETNAGQSGPEWDGTQWTQTEPSCPCPFCDELFLTANGIENHLVTQYLAEQKRLRTCQNCASDLGAVSASLPTEVSRIEVRAPNVTHLNGLDAMIKTVKQVARILRRSAKYGLKPNWHSEVEVRIANVLRLEVWFEVS